MSLVTLSLTYSVFVVHFSYAGLPEQAFKYNSEFLFITSALRVFLRTNKVTAIDVGLTHFCTLSDGTKIKPPKYLIKAEKRLKKIQRELSKKTNRLEKMENPKAESCKTPRENSQPKKRFST